MQEIDAVEVNIFYMPAEKAFPHAKVDHRACDSRNAGNITLLQQVSKILQIPTVWQLLVEKGLWCVCSIDGRIDRHRAPELSLKPIILTATCVAVLVQSSDLWLQGMPDD